MRSWSRHDGPMDLYSRRCLRDELEAWEARLEAAGVDSVVITDDGESYAIVEGYFKEPTAAWVLQAAFGGQVSTVVESALTDGWEPLPVPVGQRFLIVGGDDEEKAVETTRTVLRFERSEQVFDGQRHPTTLACLRWILTLFEEERLPPSARCLDVGFGTGILGIASALCGAESVDGIDVEAEAVECAAKNAARYDLEGRTQWIQADLREFASEETYDLVLANLYSELLQENLGALAERLADGGHLLVSGILARFVNAVIQAADQAGLTIVEKRQSGPWVTMRMRLASG